MELLKLASEKLKSDISGGQSYEERIRYEVLNDPDYRGWSSALRQSALVTYGGIENTVLYSTPLSIARAYLSKEDFKNRRDLEADSGAELTLYAREQFGMLCKLAWFTVGATPQRREIQRLEEAFWFDGPRTAEEISAHRERVLALADADPDEFTPRNFALNLSPRSSLSAEDRVVRDVRVALDWFMVQAVRLLEEAIPSPFRIEAPDAQDQRDAYFKVMAAAAFGADYAMYEVFGTDCAVLTVDIDLENSDRLPVDVTDIVRNHRYVLFTEAAAALPDPGVPGYDRFLLIDLWRKGGGREQVLGEYPFWLKR